MDEPRGSVLNLIGATGIAAALLAAIVSLVCGLAAGRGGRPALALAARYGAYGSALGMTVAVAAMEIALLTHDFSVEYVARVGSRATPPYYTAISLWSSLDGSILFWGWILSGYAAFVALANRDRYPRYMPYVHATMAFVGLFFYGLLLGPASPFGLVSPLPADGPGPNPLLQNHPLMGLHPPMLYLGFVGLTVPFAFAIAALLSGNLGRTWLRAARRWTIGGWAFLSVGIVAGGWWSYEVLGWGGYWAWDPVENASFLPWLTATAFLHSAMVQERREMLKTWNLALVIGTFLLTLFGTFLTRSGILDSVHAFTEGLIGPLFLGFIAMVAILSLALIGWRSERLHAPGTLDGVASRETAFILNNLFFVAFTFTVLLGTMWPLVVEALEGQRISVGPPYFNLVTVPIGLAILFLMGVGPALPWRRASGEKLKRLFWLPTTVGLATASVLFLVGVREPFPLITFAFAGFVLVTLGEEFRRGVSARRRISGVSPPRAFLDLLWRNGRRYGGYTVHVGIVVIIVSLAISGTWKFEREATLDRGEALAIGDYSVRLDEVWAREEPQRFVVGSTFTVRRGDAGLGPMQPRLNFYPTSEQPIATPAVLSSLKEDLYLTLMAFDGERGRHATVRAIVNPAVPWLWIGGFIVALGAMLAIRPPRTGGGRQERTATLPARAEPASPSPQPREEVPVA